MIQDFKGRTAVLTGAGSGFGLECARIGARLDFRRRDMVAVSRWVFGWLQRADAVAGWGAQVYCKCE